MKYFVIVAGGGETSRANIEALMEDHYYANGAEGYLVLPILNAATQAQVFASQYAKEKNKDIIIYSNMPGDFPGMPPATVYQTDNPIRDTAKAFADEKSVSAFLLWSDEDPMSQSLLAEYAKAGIPCFDLTDGLSPITAVAELKPAVEPELPMAELALEDPEGEVEDDEADEEDEEEYDEDDDEVYFAVQSLIKALAKAVATELRKGPLE